MTLDAYRSFLEAKVQIASSDGFEIAPEEINPALKPHIQVAVRWALAGGRRALFSRFGTQKTTWHLEMARQTMRRIKEPALICMPLGARLSFFGDAKQWFSGEHAIKLNFIQSDGDRSRDAINLTNVESIREGKIDPRRYGFLSFDEGDILRNMSTKTFWTFTDRAKQVNFRHVATATPDPREYAELLAYAGYLDIMDVGQARTRFFKRNSEKADELTLHPHKEEEFWVWLASWALFITKPSDVDPSFSDDGYELPPIDVRWHEVPTDHRGAGEERGGQLRLLKDSSTVGVSGMAREKRLSLPARINKMMALRAELPAAHRLIWHDLEDERLAIERAAPNVVTVYGSQPVDKRERALTGFAQGRIAELAGKPVMIGSGPNFQFHCWWAIFLGVNWKFKDFIQAVHRIQRYGQTFAGYPDAWRIADEAGAQLRQGADSDQREDRPSRPDPLARIRLDIIYTEAERPIVDKLKSDWRRFEEQSARMAALIRRYGLARLAVSTVLERSMTVERVEASGGSYTCVNNDCIEEVRRMATASVDLIVTSPPFGQQYEYTPSYRDFGHTDGDEHFLGQMDFLTPELLRVLKPGRNCVVHCKDRVVEGSRSGLGFQTVAPFGARLMFHFMQHGFAFLGTTIIVTDVVRENYQTNRLGFNEQCKDGSRMGFGLAEYLHVFRKPQTDRSRGYADEPVVKLKRHWDRGRKVWITEDPWTEQLPAEGDPRAVYTLARWQLDAAGCWRSNGNRMLAPSEMARLTVKGAHRRWKAHSAAYPYDFAHHVALGEAMSEVGTLKPDFAVIPAYSDHPDVWSDVVRMRSLNTIQAARGREKHICPLPLDIVERVIADRSMPGELVFDPFAGIMTVPYCAVMLGRRGYGVELNGVYFQDGARHCRDAEEKRAARTLFDLHAAEESDPDEDVPATDGEAAPAEAAE